MCKITIIKKTPSSFDGSKLLRVIGKYTEVDGVLDHQTSTDLSNHQDLSHLDHLLADDETSFQTSSDDSNSLILQLVLTSPVSTSSLPPPSTDALQDVPPAKGDLRREKCRMAAQSRRSREAQYLTDLQTALPISSEEKTRLEKATVIRIASQALCLLNNFKSTLGVDNPVSLALQSQTMFAVIFDRVYQHIVYAPPTLADLTGYSWTNLIGMPLHDLLDSTMPETDRLVSIKLAPSFIRARATNTAQDHISALCWSVEEMTSGSGLSLALLKPLSGPPTSSPELQEDLDMYQLPARHEQVASVFRAFLDEDLVIKSTDKNCASVLGFSDSALVGRSLFDLVYLDDVIVVKEIVDAFKGRDVVNSRFIRLQTIADGDYRWSRITLSRDTNLGIICRIESSHVTNSSMELQQNLNVHQDSRWSLDEAVTMNQQPNFDTTLNQTTTFDNSMDETDNFDDIFCSLGIEPIEDFDTLDISLGNTEVPTFGIVNSGAMSTGVEKLPILSEPVGVQMAFRAPKIDISDDLPDDFDLLWSSMDFPVSSPDDFPDNSCTTGSPCSPNFLEAGSPSDLLPPSQDDDSLFFDVMEPAYPSLPQNGGYPYETPNVPHQSTLVPPQQPINRKRHHNPDISDPTYFNTPPLTPSSGSDSMDGKRGRVENLILYSVMLTPDTPPPLAGVSGQPIRSNDTYFSTGFTNGNASTANVDENCMTYTQENGNNSTANIIKGMPEYINSFYEDLSKQLVEDLVDNNEDFDTVWEKNITQNNNLIIY